MTTSHDHPVHPAVYAAEASAARACEAGHTFRARQEHLEVTANRLYEAGNGEGDALTADHAQTAGRAALAAFESATALTVCADELRALEAEVARLRVALAEAHTDCHALAAVALIVQGMHDEVKALGELPTDEEVDGAIGRAVWRAGGAR